MYKKLFMERYGNKVISEFTHDGMLYVFYNMHDNNQPYITGDKYSWELGLQYVEEIGMVCNVYFIDDLTRRAILGQLKKI